MKKVLSLLTLLTLCQLSFGEIQMPNIFGNNMVLQRQKPVKIWGKANPNAKVEIDFAGKKTSVNADAQGDWSTYLEPLEAESKGRDLVVFEDAKEQKRFKDVLVGEVWILSGQSNMRVTVRESFDLKKAQSVAEYPFIRYAEISGYAFKAQTDVKTHWQKVTAKNVSRISAVGFYFAERLVKDLGNIPVGLIQTAEGASKMRAWIPEEDSSGIAYLEKSLEQWKAELVNYDVKAAQKEWLELKAAYKKAKAEGKKVKRLPPAPTIYSKSLPPMKVPTVCYNARIAPLLGLTTRGVLWYQGESDTNISDKNVDDFAAMFERLICVWRKKFKDEDLWFLNVQISSFRGWGDADWASARWQQEQVSRKLPRCGIINTIDIGQKNNIHPWYKTEVGERLEKLALKKVYGKKSVKIYFPRIARVVYSGDKAQVQMKLGGQKLVGRGEPRGFEVKIDGKWQEAIAELKGNTVDLHAKNKDSKISGVRYLWGNCVGDNVWLFDENGLPAFPFINEK